MTDRRSQALVWACLASSLRPPPGPHGSISRSLAASLCTARRACCLAWGPDLANLHLLPFPSNSVGGMYWAGRGCRESGEPGAGRPPGIRSLWLLLNRDCRCHTTAPQSQPQLHLDSCQRNGAQLAPSSCSHPPPKGRSPLGTSSENKDLRPLGCGCCLGERRDASDRGRGFPPGAGGWQDTGAGRGDAVDRARPVSGRSDAASRGRAAAMCPVPGPQPVECSS